MKRHMRWSRVVAFAFAFAFVACGDSNSPPAKLSDAIQGSFQRQCQKAFDCKSSYVASMHQNHTGSQFALRCLGSSVTVQRAEPSVAS